MYHMISRLKQAALTMLLIGWLPIAGAIAAILLLLMLP